MTRALRLFGSVTLAAALTLVATGRAAAADDCRPVLRYSFQPDCYRPNLSAPCDKPKGQGRLELGPQFAVWVESGDGAKFVTDLMVTNMTAIRGLGNRPGHWSLPSSPKFPYGKRSMALPVWAHRRGRLYDTLEMPNKPDYELWLGFHEAYSSPDPYYCRPMTFAEIDLDAMTCPTNVFNSAKGRFSKTLPKSYYPPRNELSRTTERDCYNADAPNSGCDPNSSPATQFAAINDLDAVATATPLYGSRVRGMWRIPPEIQDGDYALYLEINKEFDNNQHHGTPARPEYEAYRDTNLPESGLRNNFGQPSVVFRVPFRINRGAKGQAAATDIAGYGDWNGATGTLHPPDSTISDAPGSGKGRLLVIEEPSMNGGDPMGGRVHVTVDPCQPAMTACAPKQCSGSPETDATISDLAVHQEGVTFEAAELRFTEPSDGGGPVEQYEIRFREDSMTAEEFARGTPGAAVQPMEPGRSVSVKLINLKPSTVYVVGVRARGCCLAGPGPIAFASFRTPDRKFTQLSGCFVATAAYGSAMHPQVDALRRARDSARTRSALADAAVRLYERASPPVAALLRSAAAPRALVRSALAPFVQVVSGADEVATAPKRLPSDPIGPAPAGATKDPAPRIAPNRHRDPAAPGGADL